MFKLCRRSRDLVEAAAGGAFIAEHQSGRMVVLPPCGKETAQQRGWKEVPDQKYQLLFFHLEILHI